MSRVSDIRVIYRCETKRICCSCSCTPSTLKTCVDYNFASEKRNNFPPSSLANGHRMAFLRSWSSWAVLSSATRTSCFRGCTDSTTKCEYIHAKRRSAV